MPLGILQNATAMGQGLTLPFAGTGGVEPYTFAVARGGVGGTIDAVSGVYTSPSARTGTDTIVLTDAAGSKVSTYVNVGNYLELFCDVIERSMELSQGQVYIYKQKINIPVDSRLYIAVGVLGCKPFSNSKTYDGDGNVVQSTNFSATLSIDILSRSLEALDRKEEIILALNSDYAEQQQELNSFKIFPLSNSFNNLSEIDGAAIPYRFNISVAIQYFIKKVSPENYFSTFSGEVVGAQSTLDTQDGDPIINQDGEVEIITQDSETIFFP